MNPARENILGRVRAALRVPAMRPPVPRQTMIWPPVTELETRFRMEFTALKGEMVESLPAFQAQFVAGEVGVTGCDCLIAQTGSIVVSTRTAGGRVLSVWPPVHLVIARRDQLVPDLAAAMALLRQRYDGNWPSLVSVTTGPSRTADIEKVPVLGAHGPKRIALYFES
jgi:hypothetical protein